MNAFDYFFEKTSELDKLFLAGKENLSFKELYNSSLLLASYLRKEFGQNKNILLLSVNNQFFLIAYFAIIKSGNICIPLDPNIEKGNLEYISGLTKPVLIFMTRDVGRKLELSFDRCIFPDTINNPEYQGTFSAGPENFDRESCAEIIFTSGSTGVPKGVMISHKNLIANTDSIITYLKLNQNDRMLVVLTLLLLLRIVSSAHSFTGRRIYCTQ